MDGIEVVKLSSKPQTNGETSRLLLVDVRDFLNTLTEDELQQPLIIWGDETSPACCKIIKLTEDFINPSGDGCEPVSAYKDEPETVEGEQIVYAEGTIVFEIE